MKAKEFAEFLQFLQNDLKVTEVDLQLALRHAEQTPSLLPMILWQYGLVTLSDVSCMFDWLESQLMR